MLRACSSPPPRKIINSNAPHADTPHVFTVRYPSSPEVLCLCHGQRQVAGWAWGDEPRRTARFDGLGEAAIHPNGVMGYSERQYADRDAWNARGSKFHRVPAPLDPRTPIGQTPLCSLTRKRVRYLPTAFCYLAYTEALEASGCVGCSNGNAAGNTFEEVILQGFFELVERDSVAIWWYNLVQRPAIDLDSFADPYLPELTQFLRTQGRSLWALDLTSDLGIPVHVALSARTEAPERILLGFGAHLDPRVALLLAVTEMNQMLAWVLPAEQGEQSGRAESIEDQDTLDWLANASLAHHPYLVPKSGVPARCASDFPQQWTDDLRDDVLACQALVERDGMEMLVLDQTRADVGLPVVKVVVPGLRHFWARFAPGRLYDVPVRLGWLPRALREEELNPIPMFLCPRRRPRLLRGDVSRRVPAEKELSLDSGNQPLTANGPGARSVPARPAVPAPAPRPRRPCAAR